MSDEEKKADGNRLTNKEYTKELRRLQAELCKLQYWVKYKGLRVIVIFEGRDAAGKGGTIRAITERARACSGWLRCPLPRTGKSRRCTCSGISSIFRPPAR